MQCRWGCCPRRNITAVCHTTITNCQMVTTTTLEALKFVSQLRVRCPPWCRQLKHLPCFFKISLLSSIFVTTWPSDARWFPLQNKQFNSPQFPLNNALTVDSLPGLSDFFNGHFFSTDVFIPHLSRASTSFLTEVSSQLCKRCAARILRFFASFPGIIQLVLTPNPALGTKCDRFYLKPIDLLQQRASIPIHLPKTIGFHKVMGF